MMTSTSKKIQKKNKKRIKIVRIPSPRLAHLFDAEYYQQASPRTHDPNIDVDGSWAKLSLNIRAILHGNGDNTDFVECYRLGFQLVVSKRGKMLYDSVSNLVVENLNRLVVESILPTFPSGLEQDPMQQSHEGERFLKAVRKVWTDHTDGMDKLSHILKYMDRVYVKSANVLEVVELGRDLFAKHIIRPLIKDHVSNAILSLMRIERTGYVINRSAIKNCVDLLLQLSDSSYGTMMYRRYLQPLILRQSYVYYSAEARRLLETCDALEYLRWVQAVFLEEESRIHQYLSLQTLSLLQAILRIALLKPHLRTLFDSASLPLDAMIDHERLDDLSLLYSVCSFASAEVALLCRSLKASVQKRGAELNRRELSNPGYRGRVKVDLSTQGSAKMRTPNPRVILARALQWVQDMLQLMDRFDRIWKVSCRDDGKINRSLNEAFELIINQHPRASEFIALYIDDNLKDGLKGKTDAEVEFILDKTINLFRFITEKDVFERYYRAYSTKRLLHNQSVSDDAERGMLAKLKVECGFQFTIKLEGMFRDMELSADTMQAYRDHLSKTTAPEVDINVTVMTSTFWPMSYVPIPCTFPPLLVKACKSFEQFYLSRHSGRKLIWQPSLGNADIRVTFKARTHDLNVSSFALAILLLFENLSEREFLTYEEIKTATSIPDSELQRSLQSLACSKFKVLRKHSAGRDVNPKDSFSFNGDFSSPLQKIKIITVASRVESDEGHKEIQARVEEERRYHIDACIVQIMKDKKYMTHNGLVNEVTLRLTSRFLPNPVNIKKRIESLVEREYLERREDHKSYNYLA